MIRIFCKAMQKGSTEYYRFSSGATAGRLSPSKRDGHLFGAKSTSIRKCRNLRAWRKSTISKFGIDECDSCHVAGVKRIVMVTPPDKQGKIHPNIAYAAKIAGVSEIYKIGGAQAIAALAYGTQSIQSVDKITGPGNIYVAAAKKMVFGKVDIDMIAGPSEILVIADGEANPEYVAADLISQAEHDPMASAILVTTSQALLEKVNAALQRQSAILPKKEIIEASFTRLWKERCLRHD